MRRRPLFIIAIAFFIITTLTSPSLGAGGTKIIQGSIESIDFSKNTITVLDYDGKRQGIKVFPSTTIEIEGQHFTIEDLYFGQEVDVILNNNKAEKIIAYPEDDPERYGYIMPGSRFKTGKVLFLTEYEIEIKDGDKREKYRITPNTVIYKNGEVISFIWIKEGDNVLLTFNDIYSPEVSTIRVEDYEKHITGVLRGKLYSVDERKEEIYIQSPYIYSENNKWEPYKEYLVKLKSNDNNLYNGSERITLSDLNRFKGYVVYIAYDSSYGRLNVSKLQIKNGSSRVYDSKIKDIEYGTGKMIVDKNLVYFDEGTIVIKDNRLVDVLNMDLNEEAKVNVDVKNGISYANIVALEGSSVLKERADNTRISIYKGKIEDIFDYEIKIGRLNYKMNYLKLTEESLWTEGEDSERISVTEDTLIYDSQLKEEIPVDSFIKSRYFDLNDIKNLTLRNRLKNNFYKGKTAYFIVRESSFGKELLALNIVPNLNSYKYNINFDYLTLGDIEKIDYDQETIALTNVKNFNTLNKRWEGSSKETLDVSNGVILYNDVPIPMDKLYTLRQGLKAYVIKFKESSQNTGYVILIED